MILRGSFGSSTGRLSQVVGLRSRFVVVNATRSISIGWQAVNNRSRNSSYSSNFLLYGSAIAAGSLLCTFSRSNLQAESDEEKEISIFEKVRSKKDLFQVFSTMDVSGVRYMTSLDILRALVLDVHEKPRESEEVQKLIRVVFELADLNFDGRISYAEFIFFLRLLSTPSDHFAVAFNVFDLDGSGTLDAQEFEKVMSKSKGGNLSVHTHTKEANENLVTKLFGKDGKVILSLADFEIFMKRLQSEVSKIQFDHYANESGKISGYHFAKLVISNANLLPDYVKNLRNFPRELQELELSFDEFLAFQAMLQNMEYVDSAMRLTASLPYRFEKDDFLRACKAVTGPNFSKSIVDILFHICDVNGDGQIGRTEFLILAARYMFFEKEKKIGLLAKLEDFWDCVQIS